MSDMPDSPDNTPPQDDAAAEAHRKKMDELFGDLDEDDADDAAPLTPEEKIAALEAEKAELLQRVADTGARMGRVQQELLQSQRDLAESRGVAERLEKKAKEDAPFAIQKLVKDILPVMDTLEQGLAAIPKKSRAEDPKFDKLAQGVELTLNQLTAVFNRFGITIINPIGEEFDMNKHEVLSVMPVPGKDPETVVQVAQKGCEMQGRLIRPAKVIVTPPE